MAFSPGSFLANVNKNYGLAKPSRFRVLLPIPQYLNRFLEKSILDQLIEQPGEFIDRILRSLGTSRGTPTELSRQFDRMGISRSLALQCESTEIPGKSLQTVDVKIYGPTFKVPIQSTYNEITFNFICTNNGFYERKVFERWIESIMPTDTNSLRYAKGNDSYLTQPKIIQYDDYVNEIHIVELIDAFPVSIAAQPLSWSEDNFHRLSVQFAYQRYRTIYTESYQSENIENLDVPAGPAGPGPTVGNP